MRIKGFGRRVAVAAATALVTFGVAGGPFAASAQAATAGGDCAPYMAYLVPGTWETHKGADSSRPVGMLRPVGDRLVKDYGSQLQVVYPAYSATAFNAGQTYAQSERDGVNTLVSMLTQCATSGSKILLGGYSQGADVAGDVAWMIGNGKGPIPASQVLAVGLLSDPKQGNAPVAGPQPGGTGIAGTRPGGFGALESVTRQICAPGDLYCGLNKGRDSFLAGLGKVLGSSSVPTEATSPASTATQSQTASLTSDYGNADFPGAVSTAKLLSATARGAAGDPQVLSSGTGAGQLAQMATMAQQLLATFAPLADSQKFVTNTPGVANTLRGAAPGSSLGQANTVLGALGKVDVAGIVSNASKIAQTLGASLGGSGTNTSVASTTPAPAPAVTTTTTDTTATAPAGANTSATTSTPSSPVTSAGDPTGAGDASSAATTGAPADDPTAPTTTDSAGAPVAGDSSSTAGAATTVNTSDLTQLASTATQLASQVAPVGSVPAQQLSTASQVLGTLKPDSIINQALAVVSTVVGTDYTGIVNNLTRLPQQVLSGDVRGAHATARALNVQFSPWVKLASVMDYKMAAQLVAMIPDTSGTTQIVSMVLNLLGNLDIIRLAKDVGQLQEVAWQVVETGNLLALSQLLPISLDLASVAVGVMSPTTKMSPEQLTAPNTAAAGLPQMQQASSTGNAAGLFSTAAQLTQSQGAQDLTTLVKEGLTAANFYASNVHTSYNKFQIDGVSAVTWLANFFSASIR